MASELSKVLGRPIRHVSIPPTDLKGAMLGEGLPEVLADRLLDLERYYRGEHASHVTNDILRVTGRKPRSFAQYARDCAPALQEG